MKIFFHLAFLLVLVNCSTPPDSNIDPAATEITDENLFKRSKLSEAEIARIEHELLRDTSVAFLEPLDSITTGPYVGSVQFLYSHRRENLTHFIKTLLVAHETIKEIRFSDGKIVFNVFGNDTLNYLEDAPFLNYSWRYYYAHDVYASFFSYPEIDTVQFLIEGDNSTWFPTSGDTDGLRPPTDYMLRKWYAVNVDYFGEGMIDIDNPEHFADWDNYIVNSALLESKLGKLK